MERYDVAVIGAGPAGSYAAGLMARAGLKVALMEKEAEPGRSAVCAGGIHVDAARFVGIPEEVIERRLNAFRLYYKGRRREWTFDAPPYLTMVRTKLDPAMARQAGEAGAVLMTGSRVTDVKPEEETLLFEKSSGGSKETLRARVFVFADGFKSLAHDLFPEGGPSPFQDSLIAALAWELEAEAAEFPALELHLSPGEIPLGYAWIFPKSDHVNVGLGNLIYRHGPDLTEVLERFIEGDPRLAGKRVIRKKGGVIPAAAAKRLLAGNCLVIGDAAGMVNPLTGGGYVCGFKSASVAAGVCAEAFKGGRFDPEKLRRYPRRLRLTKHYLTIRSGSLLLRSMRGLHRIAGVTAYPAVLNLYLRLVHLLMRLGAKPM